MRPKTVYYWLRIINDMTRESVADGLSISESYVSVIESGRGKPSAKLRNAYAELFGIRDSIITAFEGKEKTWTEKKMKNTLQDLINEM